MFDEEFLVRVVLSFLVGGLWIGIMTRISERFGSKLGGLLISMPSTALVGLAFIALTQNSDVLRSATTVMPSSIAASTIFLVVFVLLHRYGWFLAYFGAIGVWFVINLPLVILKIENISLSLILAVLLFSISVTYFHKHPHRELPKMELPKKVFIFRVIFAGSFIVLAVLFAKLAGPGWGGMFSSFPAAFSATVIIFARSYGIEFTSSLSRTMVNGNIANTVFVTSIFLLVPYVGATLGMLFAYFICLGFAAFSYRYIVNHI